MCSGVVSNLFVDKVHIKSYDSKTYSSSSFSSFSSSDSSYLYATLMIC